MDGFACLAQARALGHQIQHVLTTAETTAAHCVELKNLPKDAVATSGGKFG